MIQQPQIPIELYSKDLSKGMAVLFEIYSRCFFRVSKTVSEILIDYYNNDLPVRTLVNKYSIKDHDVHNIINHFKNMVLKNLDTGEPGTGQKKEDQPNELKRLTMNVSNDCNMRCLYCYADYGSYNWQKGLMTIETVDRTIDLLLTKFNQISNVMIFGGEPFLNPDAILHMCEKFENLKKNNILRIIPNYIVSTNGTMKSDKIQKILSKYNFEVSISLDGPAEINDTLRFLPNRESVFKNICENINWLKGFIPTKRIMIEAVYTNKHIEMDISKIELYNFLSSTFGINRIRISPVIVPEDNPLAIKLPKENSKEINKFMDSEILSYIYTFLRFRHDKYVGEKNCEAGKNILAISSDGSIWPCHFFVGIHDFLMGNVEKSDTFKSKRFLEVQKKMTANNVNCKNACKKCWMRILCTKGCPATKYRISGNTKKMNSDFCQHAKFLTEKALVTLGEAKGNNLEWEQLMIRVKNYLGFIQT